MKNANLLPLKGFRDFLPVDARKRQWVKTNIQRTFENWGYQPIETPTLESLSIFAGQIGEEEKLFYKFKDYGNREIAMRYDQTVPTARFVANYQNELSFPFKRYQIQNVFRAEKPQRGRYREFTQCDADIFGVKSPIADAEVISLSLDIYRNLGFKNATVLISDRSLMKGIPYSAVVAVDKLKKIGRDGVIQEMVDKGISKEDAEGYLKRIETLRPNETVSTILTYLKNTGFSSDWYTFEPTIARSFSYSDGPIWEVIIPEFTAGSVLGGERYDGLISKISGRDIPATGFAVGFDRTVEAADQLGLIDIPKSSTQVLVALFDEQTLEKSLEVATKLRNAGVSTEVYPAIDKLGKQFKLADQKNIPFVIIVGEDELKNDTVTIKNMVTGNQENGPEASIIELIQKQ